MDNGEAIRLGPKERGNSIGWRPKSSKTVVSVMLRMDLRHEKGKKKKQYGDSHLQKRRVHRHVINTKPPRHIIIYTHTLLDSFKFIN